jgi:uncharacterized protein
VAIVVSDTSPIRALAHLGLVPLLADLFGTVFVPPAVGSELLSPPAPLPRVDVAGYPFIVVRTPGNPAAVSRFRQEHLDAGESEALALALEIKADLVLIDERAGRSAAERAGLTPLGLLGVLIRAKARGSIPAVAPLIDTLQQEIGFFISPALRREALRLASEAP